LQCPQSTVTRLIRPRLLDLGGRTFFECQVTGVTDRDGGVEIRTDTGTIRARYAVGADGAGSTVRKSLGIRLAGKTYPDRFLLVGTQVEAAAVFPGMGPVAYVFDPDEWVVAMHLPDHVRLVFRIDRNEVEPAAPGSVARRLARLLGPDRAPGVRSVSIYSVHQRVADRFRHGAVLLAGDAAHVNNPIGGFGMNAGIHDAYALATALDAALGGAGDAVLDDYATLRREVAVRRVNNDANANYERLSAQDTEFRARRNAELYEAAADPSAARRWLLRASMLDQRVPTPTT
jgi:3-(3-hydroxy-phenyl)propionate hydroxylase